MEIPGLLQFERGRIVNLNFKAGAINVQLLAVARHAETEARPARNFDLLSQTIRGQIERPKLAALVSPEANVTALSPVGGEMKVTAAPSVPTTYKFLPLKSMASQ